MANRIHNLKTVVAERPYGQIPAVQIGIDIDDPANVDSFVAEVAEKVLLQRMCSPPDTGVLFVSIVGDLSTTEFKQRWTEAVGRDKALTFFMSQMREATVLRGLQDGTVLEHISLLDEAEKTA